MYVHYRINQNKTIENVISLNYLGTHFIKIKMCTLSKTSTYFTI